MYIYIYIYIYTHTFFKIHPPSPPQATSLLGASVSLSELVMAAMFAGEEDQTVGGGDIIMTLRVAVTAASVEGTPFVSSPVEGYTVPALFLMPPGILPDEGVVQVGESIAQRRRGCSLSPVCVNGVIGQYTTPPRPLLCIPYTIQCW